MSKKNAILLVLIVASLLIGSLLGFYFYTVRNSPSSSFLGIDANNRNFADFTDTNRPSSNSTSTAETPTVITPGTDAENPAPVEVPRLRKIYEKPVTGADFIDIDVFSVVDSNIEPEDTSRTRGVVVRPQQPRVIRVDERIRFLDRATGHIYETSSSTLENLRITNTTIPRLQEAYFVEKGQSLILRGLIGSTDVIETKYATIQMSTTSEDFMSVVTKSLPVNILQSVRSPLRNLVFNIQKAGVTGFISTPDGGGIQNVLTTPFTEWLVQWPERRNIALTTKASGLYPGYSYILNTDNRSFTRAIGELRGLTTNYSPDISNVLFGVTTDGRYNLLSYNLQRATTTNLGINTFPEKCVWSTKEKSVVYCAVPESMPIGLYPDTWYQGRVLLSDNLWKINTQTLEYRIISNIFESSGQFIDVENIKLSKNEDYLIFRNKIDLSLWGFNLTENVATGTATTTSSN